MKSFNASCVVDVAQFLNRLVLDVTQKCKCTTLSILYKMSMYSFNSPLADIVKIFLHKAIKKTEIRIKIAVNLLEYLRFIRGIK